MPEVALRPAYSRCGWCRRPFDEALGSILSGDPPRANHKGLAKSANLRRMLLMGQYSAHLRRWLRVFEPVRLRYFDDPWNPWFVWLADDPSETGIKSA